METTSSMILASTARSSLDQVESALSRQVDIHQHQVGLQSANGLEGLERIASFTAYGQVFLPANNPHQGFAKYRVVVDNEYPLGCFEIWFCPFFFPGFPAGFLAADKF